MEKVLFETKGGSKKSTSLIVLSSLLLIVVGIAFIVISQLKRKGVEIYSGLSGRVQEHRGKIGGGYYVSEEARQFLVVLGVILIVFAVIFLAFSISAKAAYFKAYETYFEGVNVILINKTMYNIKYKDIDSVQLVNNALLIGNSVKKTRIVLPNVEAAKKVYDIIEKQRRL